MVTEEDLIGASPAWDVILVGDLFYERPLAERLLRINPDLRVIYMSGYPHEEELHGSSVAINTVRATLKRVARLDIVASRCHRHH